MPLNMLRLNWRHQPPNERIIFIKALPGPSSSLAETYLSRIAAICVPIMKNHHLSVTTLEEFPPNREFVGRNFNAGECIQLVLKSRRGHWLPFRHVQMVMMHELAHNMQMNHGKQFWKTRDLFAGDLRVLWEKGYTGDGVWGVGRKVGLGEEFDAIGVANGWEDGEAPIELCGGTYRSRKRKRTTKPELTYQEKKQRRIEKKFGVNGQELGADVLERMNLENGKVKKGKPRVAGSQRGRELRAAAALARFDVQKKEDDVTKEEGEGSETESESEDENIKQEPDAVDINGETLRDSKGNRMIKVCADVDGQDNVYVKRELEELQQIDMESIQEQDDDDTTTTYDGRIHSTLGNAQANGRFREKSTDPSPSETNSPRQSDIRQPPKINIKPLQQTSSKRKKTERICPVCTTVNSSSTLTCSTCANVLDIELVPDHWRCKTSDCQTSGYTNAGDCGRCGICGEKRE